MPVYIASSDHGWMALSVRTLYPGCFVAWDHDQHRFFDRCYATQYDELGEFIQGPSGADLDRHAMRVLDRTGNELARSDASGVLRAEVVCGLPSEAVVLIDAAPTIPGRLFGNRVRVPSSITAISPNH